jgi:general secretion pathway protein G
MRRFVRDLTRSEGSEPGRPIAAPLPGSRETGESGWTFVETIIVIAIVLILTSSVGFVAFRYVDRARVAAARSQVQTYVLALNTYQLDVRGYPSAEQGLDALWEKPIMEPVPRNWMGPYVDGPITPDPWGQPYVYVTPGPNGLPFEIKSLGADGLEGGDGPDADISSWNR